MNCKFDSTGLCVTHGIQMHIDFAEMNGSVCPVGHIAEVERRFDLSSKELQDTLIRQSTVLFDVISRIEVLEGKLGIERPRLLFEGEEV